MINSRIIQATLFFLTLTLNLFCQSGSNKDKFDRFRKKGDSLYFAKEYTRSARAYSKALKYDSDQLTRISVACAWAMANNTDSAFFELEYIIPELDYHWLVKQKNDLKSLYEDKRWKDLLESMDAVEKNSKRNINMNWTLAARLDSIYEEDQTDRLKVVDLEKKLGPGFKEEKDLWQVINRKDSLNLIMVTSIIDKYGWLGADVVGERGNSTLFLVIQHSNLKAQEKYLPVMREAVKNNKARGSSLALLEDRILLGQGKRQIYGSQMSYDPETKTYYLRPVEDPDNLDTRRAQLGLQPIKDYVSIWKVKWDLEQYKKDLPSIEAREKKKAEEFLRTQKK